MSSPVTETVAASSDAAVRHFSAKLGFETDCWDVWASMRQSPPDFVLLDVRSPELYARSHVPGAISLPHGKITAHRMAEWLPETLFVVYCAGPHCNGADKAALKLARLGRPVKLMIGGMTGWADEGFDFETAAER